MNDKIELVVSTFNKVREVIKVNNLDNSDYIDIIKEDLYEAEELLIKSINEKE